MNRNFSDRDTALVIIDMQNDYVHQDGVINKFGLGTTDLREKISKIQGFVGALRKINFPILHIQMTEGENTIDKNLKEHRLLTFGKPENWALAEIGTWGYELILDVNKNEPIFKKNTYDIFSNPEFEQYLREKEVRNLIIIGGYTHACVDTSVRSAVTRGFKVIMPIDLVGSPDIHKSLHDNSIKVLTSLFASGINSEELLNEILKSKN